MSQNIAPMTRDEIVAEFLAIVDEAANAKDSALLVAAQARASTLFNRVLDERRLTQAGAVELTRLIGAHVWRSTPDMLAEMPAASPALLPFLMGRALMVRPIFLHHNHQAVKRFLSEATDMLLEAQSIVLKEEQQRLLLHLEHLVGFQPLSGIEERPLKAGAIPAKWLGITETCDAKINLALLARVEQKGIAKDDLDAVRAEWATMNSEKAA